MPDQNWQFELEEYIKQGEPDRAEKSEAWQTAIGLQAVDGLNTSFSGELPTLVVHNTDQPGCVSQVTGVLAGRGLNVATLQLNRGGRGGSAVMVIECDQPIPEDAARDVRALPGILRVTRYTPEEQEVPL